MRIEIWENHRYLGPLGRPWGRARNVVSRPGRALPPEFSSSFLENFTRDHAPQEPLVSPIREGFHSVPGTHGHDPAQSQGRLCIPSSCILLFSDRIFDDTAKTCTHPQGAAEGGGWLQAALALLATSRDAYLRPPLHADRVKSGRTGESASAPLR